MLHNIIRITLFFLLIPATSASAFYTNSGFRDVPDDHAYVDAISWMHLHGIVSGYTDQWGHPGTIFRPDHTINRAEFTKILTTFTRSRWQDSNDRNETYAQWIRHFPDVRSADWFAPFVYQAERQGIVAGYPDGTFQPGRAVSFVEAAKMIAVANDTYGFSFPEVEEDAPWYETFVTYLRLQNAIPTTITGLDQRITRAEMAEMVYRMHKSRMRDLALAPDPDFYGDQFLLSIKGEKQLPEFLRKIGLEELLTLKEFGGTEELTSSLCKLLVAQALQPSLSNERCFLNLQKDGETFESYGIPLIITIKEFDARYLFLLVEEEGIGGNSLFAYAYNLASRMMFTIDRGDAPTSFLYQNGKLNFFRNTGPCKAESDVCAPELESIVDFASGEQSQSMSDVWKMMERISP